MGGGEAAAANQQRITDPQMRSARPSVLYVLYARRHVLYARRHTHVRVRTDVGRTAGDITNEQELESKSHDPNKKSKYRSTTSAP